MSRPLLTAVPLFLSAAYASPPVDATRVTGNVSTEHSARPATDACRVTGNILSMASKSPTPREHCVLHASTSQSPGQYLLQMAWVERDEGTCTATGVKRTVDATEYCVLSLDGHERGIPAPWFTASIDEGV